MKPRHSRFSLDDIGEFADISWPRVGGLSSFPGETSPTPMLLFLVNYNDPTRQA
jgi:hypothetical protein